MCDLTLAAFERGCMDISGVAKLYVVDKADRISNDITYTVANGAITISGNGGTAYEIIPVQNSFSTTNPDTPSRENNSIFYTQTITGTLHANTAALSSLVENINKGRTEWAVQFSDGTTRMFGTDVSGMQANGGDGFTSGQASGDAKGANINLVCESTYIAPVMEFDDFSSAFTITEPS